MALDFQTVTVPLVAGADLKSDERAVTAPKLLRCENATFNELGGIQKRTGYTTKVLTKMATGTVGRLRALGTRQGELVLFAEGRCWAWSDKETEWMDRGRFESVLVDEKQVFHDRTDQVQPDRAELGGVIVYSWRDLRAGAVRWRCIDKVTGAVIEAASLPSVSGSQAIACRAVSTRLHVYYHDGGNVKLVVIDPADVRNTINSTPITVSSVLASPQDWAVTVVGTQALLAVRNTSAPTNKYNLYLISAAGTITTNRLDIQNSTGWFALSYHAGTDRVSVVRQVSGSVLKHDWIKGVDLTDDTSVDVSVDTATLSDTGFTTVVLPVGANDYKAHVYYDMPGGVATDGRYDRVYRGVVTSAGAVTTKVFCRHARVGSNAVAWADGSTTRSLVHVLHDHADTIQPTYFLMDGDEVVGDANGNRAATEVVGLLARVLASRAAKIGKRRPPLPQIEDLGSNQFACALTNRRRVSAKGINYVYGEQGVVDHVYTFAEPSAYRGVEEGKSLYLPGGYLAMYDGVLVRESGFLLAPDVQDASAGATVKILVSQAGAGSLVADKTYSYRIYWERYSSQGELQISTYLGAKTVTLGATHNEVVVLVPTLGVTADDNIVLAVYRTEADPGDDAPYYRTTSYDPAAATFVKNLPNADTITFTDTRADSSLRLQALDYQNVGENGQTELDHVPPPATKFLASGQARLFTLDPADPNRLHFSKQRAAGAGVEFSDSLTLQIPQSSGEVTGVDVTDDGILVFAERGIYFVAGQGPDALGNNPYTAPQRIVTGLGAVDERSVIRTAAGVFFKSDKGIYRLGGDFQPEYVGAPVEEHNALEIAEAIDIPDQHRVIFCPTDVPFLVYDYLAQQWATWTGRTATSAVYWSTAEATVHIESAALKQSDSAAFRDALGYGVVLETAWIKLNDLLGFARVRRWQILGEWRDVHKLRVRVAYDYDDRTWTDDVTFTPPLAMEIYGTPEKLRGRFSKGKTDAVKFRIEDIAPAIETNWKESIALTAIAIEGAPKRGQVKLAQPTASYLVSKS